MKRKFLIVTFLLLYIEFSFGQEYPGARQIALAHSAVSLIGDPFSIFNNPAGISGIERTTIGFYYSPSPFGMKELSNAFGVITIPSKFGNFGAGIMKYGFELYNESKFAFGFGKYITDNLMLGASAVYENIFIQNYGSTSLIYFNAGGIAQFNDKISLAFEIDNFTRSSIKNAKDQLPVVFWTGIGYEATNDILLFAALKKELGYNVSLRFGTEYKLTEYFSLRFGLADEPSFYSGGIGISINIFEFDYAAFSHSDLGFTHQVNIVAKF